MNASVEVQKALFSVLSTPSYPVYEIVPPAAKMPYITLSGFQRTDDDTKTATRPIYIVQIHTWSVGNSSLQSKEMNAFVIESIKNRLTVNGYAIDMVTLELEANLKEAATNAAIFHGVMDFEIQLTKN